jgi:hypothetical protein
MKIPAEFQAYGTAIGSDQSIRLDEVTLVANAETMRLLGIFLINTAYEMDENDVQHIHLQDVAENFSYGKHVDLIPHSPDRKISSTDDDAN